MRSMGVLPLGERTQQQFQPILHCAFEYMYLKINTQSHKINTSLVLIYDFIHGLYLYGTSLVL